MTTNYLDSVRTRYNDMPSIRLPGSYASVLIQTVSRLTGEPTDDLHALLSRPPGALDDPHVLLPLQECVALYALACERVSRPQFGLAYGAALGISSHGLLGISALTAPTLMDALALLAHHTQQYVPLFRFRVVDRSPAVISLEFCEGVPLYTYRQSVLETLLATLVRACRDMLPGLDNRHLEAELDWPTPEHEALYERWVGIRVRFGQHGCRLNINAELAQQPLPYTHCGTHRHCLELLESVASRHYRRDTLSAQVTVWLGKQAAPLPTIAEAASYFSLSTRSFRKRLFNEGSNYRDLASREIMARAHDLLARTNLTVSEISDRLGFSEGCNFSRAFSRETGMAPLVFRTRVRSAEDSTAKK